jgi:hypothetical protein
VIRRTVIGLFCMALSGSGSSAVSLGAQQITGIVVAESTGEPLGAAVISVVHAGRATRESTVAGTDGRFHLSLPDPGEWLLSVERIGYRSVSNEPIEVLSAAVVDVRITLSIDAVPLEPITIVSRRRGRGSYLEGFYTRMESGRGPGLGHFISREDVDQVAFLRPSDLLRRVPGLQVDGGRGPRGAVVGMRGGCVPAVFIDGSQINLHDIRESVDDYLEVPEIEGVEVYVGASARVQGFYDPRGCGVVLIWTRLRIEPDTDASWSMRVLIVGLVAGLVLLLN